MRYVTLFLPSNTLNGGDPCGEEGKRNSPEKEKGRSTQELLGIKTFTKYGLAVGKYELLFYMIAPTNISVLSRANIEIKIHHLMMVLSAVPDIEVTCTDSCECFDDNKTYLQARRGRNQSQGTEDHQKDIDFLDDIQTEMATARQFLLIGRCRNLKPEQVFNTANRIEKVVSEQGFETHRMKKAEIKRFLAVYFEASMNGDQMPDTDGEQFFDGEDSDEEEA